MKAARIQALCATPTAGGAATFLVGRDDEMKSGARFVQFATPDVRIAHSDLGTDTALSRRTLQRQGCSAGEIAIGSSA
jgi:hypothetical protein